MMEQVVEIQQRGLPLVVSVEVPQDIKLGDEALKRQCANVVTKSLVADTRGLIERFTGIAQYVALSCAATRGLARILPLAFASPSLELYVIAFARFGTDVEKKFRNTASGHQLSCRIARSSCDPR